MTKIQQIATEILEVIQAEEVFEATELAQEQAEEEKLAEKWNTKTKKWEAPKHSPQVIEGDFDSTKWTLAKPRLSPYVGGTFGTGLSSATTPGTSASGYGAISSVTTTASIDPSYTAKLADDAINDLQVKLKKAEEEKEEAKQDFTRYKLKHDKLAE